MTWAPAYYLDNVGQLKAYLRVPADDVLDDSELEFAAIAASRAIDRATRRQFGKTSLEARYFTPEWDAASLRYVVRVDDIAETGEGFLIEVDTAEDQTYATVVTSFQKLPLNAAATSRPWERITLPASVAVPLVEGSVKVTAVFGWDSVPATVKQACMVQAARFYKRRESPFGVAGSPEFGSEVQLRDRVDVDVAVMLRPYRRQVWA